MLWPLVGSATWKCGNVGEGSEKTMKNKVLGKLSLRGKIKEINFFLLSLKNTWMTDAVISDHIENFHIEDTIIFSLYSEQEYKKNNLEHWHPICGLQFCGKDQEECCHWIT